MSLQTPTPERRVIPFKPQQPVGGALIDSHGREIPITEHMIQLACDDLKEICVGAARQA